MIAGKTQSPNGFGMNMDTANLLLRDRRDTLKPAVDKVFTVAVETGMSPDELEAVLLLAWNRVMARGILTRRPW